MGKTFIEKILRSTEVAKVYLILRQKRGIKAETRMLKIFDDPVSVLILYFIKNLH